MEIMEERIRGHPCFDESSCHVSGRIHLPVAPLCNIQCNYCDRRFDCVNESRPGVCSRILSLDESLKRLEDTIKKAPYIKVVAIAGPGEPLANEETFETLKIVRERFPQLKRCLSTNGLLLSEKIEDLLDAGVDTLTITMNALDPAAGAEIYALVRYNGEILKGEDGARLLIEKQIKGLRDAVSSGIVVKINTVYVPGINDGEITKIAELGKREGAFIQNVIPLIPQYNFSYMRAPTAEEMRSVRRLSGAYMKQMLHCAHCRSDAAGLLSRDVKLD
jgi:nitrogen fixation protein NifB